jgi:hypothetical protein
MIRILTPRRFVFGFGASVLLVGALAGPMLATDTVSVGITGGVLSASVANLVLPSAVYQNAAHDVTSTMTLTIDDSTNSNLGWGVTTQASAFVFTLAGVPTLQTTSRPRPSP